MAKKRKLPKKPKLTASIETWKSWEKRAAEVKKHNNKIDSDRNAKLRISKKY